MKGDRIAHLSIQIYREVVMCDGSRVVLADPIAQKWDSLQLANHNIFRLDANNEVIWQVIRHERGHMLWDVLHKRAKQEHAEGNIESCYTAEGFLDPFMDMGMDESGALTAEPKGIWRPGCVIGMRTHWWGYMLDPETGIATCTGEQQK